MQPQPTDLELIQAVLAGTQSAYAALVNRHKRFVFTMAMKFVRNREDAEEIAQDSFVKAYKALGTFQQQSKFSTWLYTITYTTAMTFLRKKRLVTASIDDEQNFLQLESHQTDDQQGATERKSKYVYLNMAIARLLPDDATIITLFYQGEQHLEEIGKALHMEPNLVKVKLFRARLRLKEQLEKLLKEEVKELL